MMWQARMRGGFGASAGRFGAPMQGFQQIDANKDQMISQDELLAQFKKVDTDKDGQITRTEAMKAMFASQTNARSDQKTLGAKQPGSVRRRPDASLKGTKKPEPQKKASEKKTEPEAPKSETAPEAKPVEEKPADAKTSDAASSGGVEPVVASKPERTGSTSVEASRPEIAPGLNSNEQTEHTNEPRPEAPPLPSA